MEEEISTPQQLSKCIDNARVRRPAPQPKSSALSPALGTHLKDRRRPRTVLTSASPVARNSCSFQPPLLREGSVHTAHKGSFSPSHSQSCFSVFSVVMVLV